MPKKAPSTVFTVAQKIYSFFAKALPPQQEFGKDNSDPELTKQRPWVGARKDKNSGNNRLSQKARRLRARQRSGL